MEALTRVMKRSPYMSTAIACTSVLVVVVGVFRLGASLTAHNGARPGTPGVPYANMPTIAPIGVRVDKYVDIPDTAKGPTVDPSKGYRTQKLGDGLYMITDNGIQSVFMTYEDGVVVIDAPQAFGSRIPAAVAEVTNKPITHLIYSHFHADHIGGAKAMGGKPIIIAHTETNTLLERDKDPNRPLATVTFDKEYRLSVGSQVLELSYHGTGHSPGNIFIHAPKQRTLIVIDVIFPGWMPWRRLALAQDVPGVFEQVREISKMDFDTFVGGHVARTGTRADVATQLAFMEDLRAAAQTALKSNTPGEGLNPADRGNTWAFFDHYIDRVAIGCVNQLSPKWSTKLAVYDVYIWDQCYAMEQSLRID